MTSPHPHTHRFVRAIYLRIIADDLVENDVCAAAGVHRSSWGMWKHKGTSPNLRALEAMAEVVGLRLVLKPMYDKEDDG